MVALICAILLPGAIVLSNLAIGKSTSPSPSSPCARSLKSNATRLKAARGCVIIDASEAILTAVRPGMVRSGRSRLPSYKLIQS